MRYSKPHLRILALLLVVAVGSCSKDVVQPPSKELSIVEMVSPTLIKPGDKVTLLGKNLLPMRQSKLFLFDSIPLGYVSGNDSVAVFSTPRFTPAGSAIFSSPNESIHFNIGVTITVSPDSSGLRPRLYECPSIIKIDSPFTIKGEHLLLYTFVRATLGKDSIELVAITDSSITLKAGWSAQKGVLKVEYNNFLLVSSDSIGLRLGENSMYVLFKRWKHVAMDVAGCSTTLEGSYPNYFLRTGSSGFWKTEGIGVTIDTILQTVSGGISVSDEEHSSLGGDYSSSQYGNFQAIPYRITSSMELIADTSGIAGVLGIKGGSRSSSSYGISSSHSESKLDSSKFTSVHVHLW